MEITSRSGTVLNNRGWCSPPFLDNLLTVVCTVARWFHKYKKRIPYVTCLQSTRLYGILLISPDFLCPVGAYLLIQPPIIGILSIRNQEVKNVSNESVSSGTACNGNANSYYSPFWYLIGTLSVSVKRFQVKIASCYQGLGQSQLLTTHSKAEYKWAGYVSSKDDNWLFYYSQTHWEAKVAPLSG